MSPPPYGRLNADVLSTFAQLSKWITITITQSVELTDEGGRLNAYVAQYCIRAAAEIVLRRRPLSENATRVLSKSTAAVTRWPSTWHCPPLSGEGFAACKPR